VFMHLSENDGRIPKTRSGLCSSIRECSKQPEAFFARRNGSKELLANHA
jgi:hypothetical protein